MLKLEYMKESPEIEKIRRDLSHKVINKKIASFQAIEPKVFRGQPALFKQKTVGSYIKRIDRHGKILIFKLASGYYIFTYLSSIGEILFEQTKYTHIIIKFKNNFQLFFNKLKPHGYLQIVNDSQRMRLMAKLIGIDPTLDKSFNYLKFRQLFKNKTTAIKNFLNNEKYFSGLDQHYISKICEAARVNPEKSVKLLENSEKKRLFRAIKRTLKNACRR